MVGTIRHEGQVGQRDLQQHRLSQTGRLSSGERAARSRRTVGFEEHAQLTALGLENQRREPQPGGQPVAIRHPVGPAMPHLQFKKMVANTILLPKLKERLKLLEDEIAKLSRGDSPE